MFLILDFNMPTARPSIVCLSTGGWRQTLIYSRIDNFHTMSQSMVLPGCMQGLQHVLHFFSKGLVIRAHYLFCKDRWDASSSG